MLNFLWLHWLYTGYDIYTMVTSFYPCYQCWYLLGDTPLRSVKPELLSVLSKSTVGPQGSEFIPWFHLFM